MRVLQAIAEYRDEHGYPPSQRDIQRRLTLSNVSQVTYWLDQLERASLVKRGRFQARSIVVTPAGRDMANNGSP